MRKNTTDNQKIFCGVCGAANDADAGFCENCGAKLDQILVYGEKKRQKSSGKGVLAAIMIGVGVLAAAWGFLLSIFLFKDDYTEKEIVESEEKVVSLPLVEDKQKQEDELDSKSEMPEEAPDQVMDTIEEKETMDEESADSQKEQIEEDEKENEKVPDPSKEILEGQPNRTEENEVVDVEAEVEYIRSIYYGVTMHLDDFRQYESADHITVYEAKSDQHIQCIVADIGAYSQDNFPLSDQYAAEYYYDYDKNSGEYTQRFLFVHNKDYSEEYRIYLTADQKCLRYIGPYESPETTYDYKYPIEDLKSITPVYQFFTYGWRELHLMGIY